MTSRDDFDEQAYLDANPDVRAAIDAGAIKSGWRHYTTCGRREGRPLDVDGRFSRTEKLLLGLDLARMRGIEIGPLTAPLIERPGADVTYVDHADTAGLRAKYAEDPNIDPARIVPIDRVWGEQSLRQLLGTGFDYVIASHVVEHVPDLVTWLEEVHAVLAPGGTLRLAIPDRRFTFDRLRATSTLADALDAHLRRARIPLPRMILDHFLHHADLDPVTGGLRGLTHPPDFALDAAARSLRSGAYQDVHCWVFTPLSFAALAAALARLGLLSLACERVWRMSPGEIEFIAVLRPARDQAHCVDTWEAAMAGLDVDQGMARTRADRPGRRTRAGLRSALLGHRRPSGSIR